jgi:hypothetical protein
VDPHDDHAVQTLKDREMRFPGKLPNRTNCSDIKRRKLPSISTKHVKI